LVMPSTRLTGLIIEWHQSTHASCRLITATCLCHGNQPSVVSCRSMIMCVRWCQQHAVRGCTATGVLEHQQRHITSHHLFTYCRDAVMVVDGRAGQSGLHNNIAPDTTHINLTHACNDNDLFVASVQPSTLSLFVDHAVLRLVSWCCWQVTSCCFMLSVHHDTVELMLSPSTHS